MSSINKSYDLELILFILIVFIAFIGFALKYINNDSSLLIISNISFIFYGIFMAITK